MSTSSFESNKSSWALTLTSSEINRVQAMLAAVSARKDGREYAWVKKTGPSTRRWYVQGYHVRSYFDAIAGPHDPVEAVTIPEYILEMASELTEVNDEVTVFLNEKENILVCRAVDQYAAGDAYDPEDSSPTFDPVTDVEPVLRGKYMREVRVDADVLERIASGYMSLRPRSADAHPGFVPPVTTLAFTPDTIRWTTDWTRIGKPAVSGAAPAVTDRYFDVTFYPLFYWTYIHVCPIGSEVAFGYDDKNVAFWGDDWAVWGRALSDLYVSWADRADEVFNEFGFERNEEDSEDDSLAYSNDDVSIGFQVIDGAAGPECIRLSYLMDGGVEITRELLLETITMSGSLVGAKLDISESFLGITVDVDNPRNSEQFKDGVTAMLTAIGRCGDFARMLPLFGDVIPTTDYPDDIPND